MLVDRDLNSFDKSTEGISFYGCYPQLIYDKTRIGFEISEKTFIKLAIFDNFGREVDNILNSEMEKGYYEYNYDCSKFAEGVYIIKLSAGQFFDSRKMFIVR